MLPPPPPFPILPYAQRMKTHLTMRPGGCRKFSFYNILQEICHNKFFFVSLRFPFVIIKRNLQVKQNLPGVSQVRFYSSCLQEIQSPRTGFLRDHKWFVKWGSSTSLQKVHITCTAFTHNCTAIFGSWHLFKKGGCFLAYELTRGSTRRLAVFNFSSLQEI